MFRLDYLSCCLTVLSTVLVGRKLWSGLVVAGINSAILCVIGIRTAQFGFVPANLFCIAVYVASLRSWKREGRIGSSARESARAPNGFLGVATDARTAGIRANRPDRVGHLS